jgi:WD40 repeat protein
MKRLKSVIDLDNKKIRLYDPESPEPPQYVKSKQWKGHKESVTFVHFSPLVDNLFVTASSDESVKLWKADTLEKEVWAMKEHSDWVWCVRFNPDGTKVASGSSDESVIITDAHSGQVLLKFDCKSIVHCLDFLSDGDHVVCGLYDSTLRSWNIKTKECVKVFEGHQNSLWSCAVSPDSSLIVSGDDNGVIKLWDRVTGECKQSWKEHIDAVRCVFYSKSGNKVLSSSYDGMVILWNVKDGKVIQKFEGHEDWVCSCALSSDETIVFTASDDKSVKIWDTQTGACLQTIFFDRRARSFSLSPDEYKAIACCNDGYLSLLQRLPGSVVHSISISSVPVSSVLSIDQSTIVVTSKKKEALIIDTDTGKILHQTVANGKDICLDMDGQTLVSKRVAMKQYQQRCLMAGFLLMYGAGSKFSNRSKLSIWDVEEVFCNSIIYDDIGIETNEIYHKIK